MRYIGLVGQTWLNVKTAKTGRNEDKEITDLLPFIFNDIKIFS